MKVISLWQPWAALWSIGAKRGAKGKETRSWGTGYRGPILIHAAKKFTKEQKEICLQEPFKSVLAANGYNSPDELPLGAIVGKCDLADCHKITHDNTPGYPEVEFGDYTPGRYYWDSQNNEPINPPIPATGRQGLWNFNMKVVE